MDKVVTMSPIKFPPISQDQLVAYSKASGDPNLIHLDPEVAKSSGLPGVIAHGMLVAGMVSERARKFMLESFSNASVRVENMQIRFKAMTLLGDELTISGTATQPDLKRVHLSLEAHSPRGEVVATAQMFYVTE